MPMNSFQRRQWSLKMSGITGIDHGQTTRTGDVRDSSQDAIEHESTRDAGVCSCADDANVRHSYSTIECDPEDAATE